MPPENVEAFLQGGNAVFQGQVFHAISTAILNGSRGKGKLSRFLEAAPLRSRLGRPLLPQGRGEGLPRASTTRNRRSMAFMRRASRTERS